MTRYVVTGMVVTAVVAVVSFLVVVLAGLDLCLGDGDTYAVDSHAATFCDGSSKWAAIYPWTAIGLPVACMIACVALSAGQRNFKFLGLGVAVSAVLIVAMGVVSGNLDTDCTAAQVKRGDNCGY